MDIVQGDVLDPASLTPALQGVDAAYYLIHSMIAGKQGFADADRTRWHQVLFQMLRFCKKIRLEGSTDADLRLRHATLLDLYIDLFLHEIEQLLHRGLVPGCARPAQQVLVGQLQILHMDSVIEGDRLLDDGIPVSIRWSRGAGARAACGQLALLPDRPAGGKPR